MKAGISLFFFCLFCSLIYSQGLKHSAWHTVTSVQPRVNEPSLRFVSSLPLPGMAPYPQHSPRSLKLQPYHLPPHLRICSSVASPPTAQRKRKLSDKTSYMLLFPTLQPLHESMHPPSPCTATRSKILELPPCASSGNINLPHPFPLRHSAFPGPRCPLSLLEVVPPCCTHLPAATPPGLPSSASPLPHLGLMPQATRHCLLCPFLPPEHTC